MRSFSFFALNLSLIFFCCIAAQARTHALSSSSLPRTTAGVANDDSLTKSPRMPAIPAKKSTSSSKNDSSRSKTYNAERIVITGARNEVLLKNSPVRVEIIDQAVTKTTGMVNLGNMLQEQTGLLITNHVRSGVQMMGLNPDYTLILIDGQPVIGRVAGVIDLTRLSVGNVQQVEIVKGPMSSLYGSDALAGVINIITRKPQPGWSGRLYSQMIERGAAEVQGEINYGGDAFDVAVFGNYKNASGFQRTQIMQNEQQRDTLTVPFAAFNDRTVQARIKWYPASNLNLSANLRYFGTGSEGAFIESFFGQVASNKGSVQQSDYSATLAMEWTLGKARLSAQTYASLFDETYNFDVAQGAVGRTDNLQRRISRSLVQYDVLWNEKNRFTLGAEFQLDDASGSRYPTNPQYRTFVGFGQWEGNPLDWLSYALSARYDATSAFGNSFNPRFSLLFKPSDALQIRASGGTGFKAPDFRQLYVEFSNRLAGAGYDLIGAYRLGNTLQPERSMAFDLGAVWNMGTLTLGDFDAGAWNLDARLFHNNLTNLIEVYRVGRTNDRDVYSYRNVARAYTQGLELNLRSQIPLAPRESLTASFGYQYLEAMDMEVLAAIQSGTAGAVDASTGAFIPLKRQDYRGLWFRPPHSGALRLQYDDDANGWSANIRVQYIGTMGDEALDRNGFVIGDPPRKVWDSSSEDIPAYWNINLACSKTFPFAKDARVLGISSLRATCGVNNMLDALNLRSLPNLVGRQFFVNLNVEW
ncbi:MAG: TonB-dependent receptor [Candidatus Kapaibacterium sp.]|nr:MAG: TonB-dependent receptor [Candidatus Kapabacteria bacterium]